MELFNTSGFLPQDKVFVILEDEMYYGTVLQVEDHRIKVDYTAKSEIKPAIDWFHNEYWTKITNK